MMLIQHNIMKIWSSEMASTYKDALIKSHVPWVHRDILVASKYIFQSCVICYMADGNALPYKYASVTLTATAWTTLVSNIKARVEKHTRCVYNACFLNHLRNGYDQTQWMSNDSITAIACFGASRECLIRDKAFPKAHHTYTLSHGEVLHIQPDLNLEYCIPRKRNEKMPCVLLYFTCKKGI
jgi:hypothetical protein